MNKIRMHSQKLLDQRRLARAVRSRYRDSHEVTPANLSIISSISDKVGNELINSAGTCEAPIHARAICPVIEAIVSVSPPADVIAN